MRLSLALCVGLCFFALEPADSFVNFLHPIVSKNSDIRHSSEVYILPLWAEVGPVLAQLALTPAVVYLLRNQMQGEVTAMSQKVVDYESTMLNTTLSFQESQTSLKERFASDMKSAVGAYQQLYGGISRKIDKVILNAERGASFEEDLMSSMSELQGLANDIYELKTGGEVTKSSMEKLLQNMRQSTGILLNEQIELGNTLEVAQEGNLQERGALRRDMMDKQFVDFSYIKSSLVSYQNDVEGITMKTQNQIEMIAAVNTATTENNKIINANNLLIEDNRIQAEKEENERNENEKEESIINTADLKLFESVQQQIKSIETLLFADPEPDSRILSGKDLEIEKLNNEKAQLVLDLKLLSERLSSLDTEIEEGSLLDKIEERSLLKSQDIRDQINKNEKIRNIETDMNSLKNVIADVTVLENNAKILQNSAFKTVENIQKLTENTNIAADDVAANNRLQVETKKEISLLESMVQGLTTRLFSSEKEINQNLESQKSKSSDFSDFMKNLESTESTNLESVKKVESINNEIKELKEKSNDNEGKNSAEKEKTKEQLDSMRESVNNNSVLSTEQINELNENLSGLWNENANQINDIKNNQQGLSVDMVDSMERFEDVQTSQRERTKLGTVRTETDVRQRIGMLRERIEDVSEEFINVALVTDVDRNRINDSIITFLTEESTRIDNTNSQLNSMISSADDAITSATKKIVKAEVSEYNTDFEKISTDAINNAKTTISSRINEFDVRTMVDVRVLEEKEELQNLRLKAMVTNSAIQVKNSVNIRIDGLQNEIKTAAQEWDAAVKEVDSSVEDRTAVVVERMGFRATAKRTAGKILSGAKGLGSDAVSNVGRGVNNVGAGVKTVGRGVRGVAIGGFERLRTIGGVLWRGEETEEAVQRVDIERVERTGKIEEKAAEAVEIVETVNEV